MSRSPCAVLVMAKAPVAGSAKTRLAPQFGPAGAAQLAAAALLDTLAAVREADVSDRLVALTGDLAAAERSDELAAALGAFTVFAQRGDQFGQRLAGAHLDAAASGMPVLQIGMDTPQVTGRLLGEAAALLTDGGTGAVLGPAADGGWWALGLTRPESASVLRDVPMSRPDTGARTAAALASLGVEVALLPELTDVDTPGDVWAVAAGLGAASHFRRAAEALDGRGSGASR